MATLRFLHHHRAILPPNFFQARRLRRARAEETRVAGGLYNAGLGFRLEEMEPRGALLRDHAGHFGADDSARDAASRRNKRHIEPHSSFPRKRRAVRGKSCGDQERKSASQFRLDLAWPVGLQPTDEFRGHPRPAAVETKTWMRGTNPRKMP